MVIHRIKIVPTPGVQWIQLFHGARFLDCRYDEKEKIIDLAFIADNGLTKLDASVFVYRDCDIIPEHMQMYLGRAITPSGDFFLFISSFTNIDWVSQE